MGEEISTKSNLSRSGTGIDPSKGRKRSGNTTVSPPLPSSSCPYSPLPEKPKTRPTSAGRSVRSALLPSLELREALSRDREDTVTLANSSHPAPRKEQRSSVFSARHFSRIRKASSCVASIIGVPFSLLRRIDHMLREADEMLFERDEEAIRKLYQSAIRK